MTERRCKNEADDSLERKMLISSKINGLYHLTAPLSYLTQLQNSFGGKQIHRFLNFQLYIEALACCWVVRKSLGTALSRVHKYFILMYLPTIFFFFAESTELYLQTCHRTPLSPTLVGSPHCPQEGDRPWLTHLSNLGGLIFHFQRWSKKTLVL